ncbi:MAG TPA: hypothetical protein VII27_02585 [Thermoplasmata archaeon]
MPLGELRSRGPMGFRSTSVKVDQTWEDASPYVPPLVYAIVQNRGSVLGSLRRIFRRAENP